MIKKSKKTITIKDPGTAFREGPSFVTDSHFFLYPSRVCTCVSLYECVYYLRSPCSRRGIFFHLYRLNGYTNYIVYVC